MNKLTYIISLFVLVAAAACTDPDLPNIKLQDLPGYVAFNPPGSEFEFDSIDLVVPEDYLNSGGEPFWEHPVNFDSLNIECPTGNLDNINVTFAFSGTAVFGVDFDMAGTTAAGGVGVIKNDPSQAQLGFFNHVNLPLEILQDGVADGNKILVITITDVNAIDGTQYAIGRGGLDLLNEVEFTLVDVD